MGQVYALHGSSVNVLDFREILEDANAFYVVMPHCNGGDLFEFISAVHEVPEKECKRIIREILLGVGTLHEHNLVHRDVKPENTMFHCDSSSGPGSPKVAKLIDFDTVVEYSPGSLSRRQFVGTPHYFAPEVLLGEILPQSDLWSIGIILYFLITGELPWTHLPELNDGTVGSAAAKRMHEVMRHELAALDWDDDPWPDFPQARDLCQKLLAWHVADRPASVQLVLDHVWLRHVVA
eukprot:NODE_422_length_1575_cov_274.651316.p1 GENE.NODE_422_length_1575_cov_274.651316~~NODE_422_length_1575_cov_274.651316.p1  ORF type:complete len:236 (-),score=43.67 NODE_422_length_1575_cov_274.651316:110-817(-)